MPTLTVPAGRKAAQSASAIPEAAQSGAARQADANPEIATSGAGLPEIGGAEIGSADLQQAFFAHLARSGARVSIYLVNGIRLIGAVLSADAYTVMLQGSAGTQLVYKHAICTVVPMGAESAG